MTFDQNLADLEQHRREFVAGEAFAYSVLDGDDVIGCVYIAPDGSGAADAMVRSWVPSRAERDRISPLSLISGCARQGHCARCDGLDARRSAHSRATWFHLSREGTARQRARAEHLDLPGVTERISHGEPCFFVQNKRRFATSATSTAGDGRISLWCPAPAAIAD